MPQSFTDAVNIAGTYAWTVIPAPMLNEDTGEIATGISGGSIVEVEVGGGWETTALTYFFYSYGDSGFINLVRMSGTPQGLTPTMSSSNYSYPSPSFPNPYTQNSPTRLINFDGMRLTAHQMYCLAGITAAYFRQGGVLPGIYGTVEPLEPYNASDLSTFAGGNSTNINAIKNKGFANVITAPSVTDVSAYRAYNYGWKFVGEYAQSWMRAFPSSIYKSGTSDTNSTYARNVSLG